MLLSPGQKVRNNDMHLLDMVRHFWLLGFFLSNVAACGLTLTAVPQAQYYVFISYTLTHFNYHTVANFRNTMAFLLFIINVILHWPLSKLCYGSLHFKTKDN